MVTFGGLFFIEKELRKSLKQVMMLPCHEDLMVNTLPCQQETQT